MNEFSGKQLSHIYTLGAISTLLVLIGIITDIVVGSSTGGNLTLLPNTAINRFSQLHENPLLGLYNSDLLNIINQLLLLPTYFVLYVLHRNNEKLLAQLAFVIFCVGSALFVANNTGLTLFDLSRKYFETSDDVKKQLYAAAGEAMLAKGTHGSFSAFIGFIVPNIAGLLMSIVMLTGKIFSRFAGWTGIAGSIFLIIYVVLVTFVPGIEKSATAFAAPGGILTMIWLVIIMIRLLKSYKG